MYNASGRGIPDVAAIGLNVEVAYQEIFGLVTGTSISAPVFASTIALLNDRLIASGKPTLGLIQPLLYENPHALTDIIYGSNPGCNTVSHIPHTVLEGDTEHRCRPASRHLQAGIPCVLVLPL